MVVVFVCAYVTVKRHRMSGAGNSDSGIRISVLLDNNSEIESLSSSGEYQSAASEADSAENKIETKVEVEVETNILESSVDPEPSADSLISADNLASGDNLISDDNLASADNLISDDNLASADNLVSADILIKEEAVASEVMDVDQSEPKSKPELQKNMKSTTSIGMVSIPEEKELVEEEKQEEEEGEGQIREDPLPLETSRVEERDRRSKSTSLSAGGIVTDESVSQQ